MCWATFWAFLHQTHLVTLSPANLTGPLNVAATFPSRGVSRQKKPVLRFESVIQNADHQYVDKIIRILETSSKCWKHHQNVESSIKMSNAASKCCKHHQNVENIIKMSKTSSKCRKHHQNNKKSSKCRKHHQNVDICIQPDSIYSTDSTALLGRYCIGFVMLPRCPYFFCLQFGSRHFDGR
jgi:hypothetical protein